MEYSNINIWTEIFKKNSIFTNELIEQMKNFWFRSTVEDILKWNYWVTDAVIIWEKLQLEVILELIKLNKEFKSSSFKGIFSSKN